MTRTHTTQLALSVGMIMVAVIGMSLMSCVPTPSVSTPAATEQPVVIHLTRTAEAAAVQTIEAALAEKARPAIDVEATARALADVYTAQTVQAMRTAVRTATATSHPPTTTPVLLTPTRIIFVVTATPTDTPIARTPTPTPAQPVAGATRVWEKDGSVMVYVPAGEFTMGSSEGEGDDDEHPQHMVYVSGFWIDQTEVTNAQFAWFVDATGHSTDAEKDGWGLGWTGSEWKEIEGADWHHPDGPETTIADKIDHPVVQVSWSDAQAYCQRAGKRLPTEAEWEKAARGTDGRKYPWGDTFDGSRLNFCDVNCELDSKDNDANDGYPRTAPVGSYPGGASPYGALDMAGNVWEWCQDWYGSDYYASSPPRDPQGPGSGEYRVGRGGSWMNNERDVRAVNREWDVPNFRGDIVSFRCVSLAP